VYITFLVKIIAERESERERERERENKILERILRKPVQVISDARQ
jgi:hypothetical protein